MDSKNHIDPRKQLSPVIGSYLKSLRLKNNKMSQVDLSARIPVSASYIGYIENALRLPSVEILRAYADFFDVSLDELLYLRELTIFETVDSLGDEAPVTIKNERNMIAHSVGREKLKEDASKYEYSKYVENEAKNRASKEGISVKLTIMKDGSVKVDGNEILIDDLGDYLKSLSNKQ